MKSVPLIALIGLLLATSLLPAAEGRIIKVLPHLFDSQGRHSLSPSLYERDAYQALLRKNPDQCSGLRFDVQWKAKTGPGPLRLQVEARGSKSPKPITLHQEVRSKTSFSRWSAVILRGEAFAKFGQVSAWRVTLWDGDRLLAEERSLLW